MVNDISIRVTKSFEAQSMLKTLRARLYNLEKGKVVIEAPILPTALQQQGYGHAGLTFGPR